MTDRDALAALERLENLRTAGALTEVEFAREKQRLLNPGDVGQEHWLGGGWRRVGVFLVALLVVGGVSIAALLLMPAPNQQIQPATTDARTAPTEADGSPSQTDAVEASRTAAATPPTDTVRMICGMDECTWIKLGSVTQASAPGGSTFMKFSYRAGTSVHTPRDDGAAQYPERYDPSIAVEWEDGSGAVLCSTQRPTVIEPDESGGFYATRLNLLDVIGAEEYSANLYMFVCHGWSPAQWDADKARSLGYTDRPSSQFKVANPEAVLTSTQ